jgi:hypothetical protein
MQFYCGEQMKIIFVGVFYYEGHTRHLFHVFEVFGKLARIFEAVGIECRYFAKQNELLPDDKLLTEDQFNAALPEADCVFMWNGSLAKEKEIAEQCNKIGIPVYFCELGWLPQSGTLYFDRKGINYSSSLRDWQYSPLSEDQQLYVRSKLAYFHQCIAKTTGINPGDDFVFAPLQVEEDSQIRVFSRFDNMQQVIDYICDHVPGRIIFKKHPKGKYGELKAPARCEIVDGGTTHDYLPRCQYVITVNSTVGIEALSYYKPVIVLGRAFYGGRRISREAFTDPDMKAAVEWAKTGSPEIPVIEAFLHHLFRRQWHRTELTDPKKVMTLIRGLTE